MQESDNNPRLRIGHVLFIDIVGYSKLLNEEQKERLSQLTEIVLATTPVREATDEQLVRLPTGDGMALVFRHSAEEPARCALEIAEALQKHPELPVRMGIHSGPVNEVTDVSGRTNLAGAGINMAQRVMDCGDAGHILLSQHVADDLIPSRQWASRLRDLGECEVKHGVRLHLVNLYANPLGNDSVPQKLQQATPKPVPEKPARRRNVGWIAALAALALIAAGAAYYFSAHRATPNAPAIPEKSIAVMPLVNSTGDAAQEYFSDGMSEEFISTFSRLPDLKVIGRSSSFQFKGKNENSKTVGEKLGVFYLLEGSVRKSADRVRIAVALTKASDGANVWSETYDRELKDIFAVQSEIAGAVAKELKVALLGSNGQPAQLAATATPSSQNVDAYNALLQGNFYGNRATAEDYHKAISSFEEAVRLDPRYALAYAGLSVAAGNLANNFAPPDREGLLAKARSSADKALDLDPNLGLAHSAKANVLQNIDINFIAAEAEYRRALELAPQNPSALGNFGVLLGRLGRLDEAVTLAQRAVALDPLRGIGHSNLAICLIALGRYDEAEAATRKAIEIQPKAAVNYKRLAVINILRGKPAAAVESANQVPDPFWRTDALALAYFANGQRAEADAALKKLIDENADDSGSQIAEVYALRKEPDKVFEWLEHGWATHDGGVAEMRFNPFLLAYKDDPRFIAFAQKVGVMPKSATHL